MNANRLLAHYERIADAPDVISRMRRFILDLAVRGKLVEQAFPHPGKKRNRFLLSIGTTCLKPGGSRAEKPADRCSFGEGEGIA